MYVWDHKEASSGQMSRNILYVIALFLVSSSVWALLVSASFCTRLCYWFLLLRAVLFHVGRAGCFTLADLLLAVLSRRRCVWNSQVCVDSLRTLERVFEGTRVYKPQVSEYFLIYACVDHWLTFRIRESYGEGFRCGITFREIGVNFPNPRSV